MKKGVHWLFRVVSKPGEPPLGYDIGLEWRTGEEDRIIIGNIRGLLALRCAYKDIPGLGGYRKAIDDIVLCGPEEVAYFAAKVQISSYCRKIRSKMPLSSYLNEEEYTVKEWIKDSDFVCGGEIAKHAEVKLSDPFIEVWEFIAESSYRWPLERWGISSLPPEMVIFGQEGPLGQWGRILSPQDTQRVFSAIEAWANIRPPGRDPTEDLGIRTLKDLSQKRE